MNEYLKNYKVKIHALSPIYIGSGVKLGKKEYIYMPWKQQVLLPNVEKMYLDICKRGLEREFSDYMMNNSPKVPSLGQWLGQHKFNGEDYISWKKYILDGGDAFTSQARPKEIDTFIKDAYGFPYVPGSSIKGMIRTALISWELQMCPEKYENIKEIIRKQSGEKSSRKWCLAKEMNQLEEQILYTLGKDERKRGNAVNDNLVGLHVGDSQPIALENLTLSQKIDYTLEGTERELPLLREAIIPGTDIEFDISVDTTVCPYSMENIVEALNIFQKNCYRNFYSRFQRGTQGSDIVWLGGGCGFLSKTVIYSLFDAEGVKIVDNIFKNTLGSSYGKHKHTKDVRLRLAPHVCKCTRYQGKLYDMGMGKIEYQEA